MSQMRFDDDVVIITGAGRGLGREHALAFAARGAAVVVNDIGVEPDGLGGSTQVAQAVVDEIVAAGGRQRMPVREYFPGKKPYRMVYVEDPFGIVFELYSHSYELTYSAGAYE